MQIERSRFKDIAEAIGILAILVSVLFLALEIRQSNRIAVASTEIGIRYGYSEFTRAIHSGPGLPEIMVKALQPDVEWSEAEKIKARMVAADIGNVWISVEVACTNEIAQPTTCAELYDDIPGFIRTYPGFRSIWQEGFDVYPSQVETGVVIAIRRALEED